jgi:hypothetical protein
VAGQLSAVDDGQVRLEGATTSTAIGNVSDSLKVNLTNTVTIIPTDGSKTTYSAAIIFDPTALVTTDFFTITGSATKTIRITYISFTAESTAAAQSALSIIKRSTANTGGTSSVVTAVPHDSTAGAATGTVRAYTTNPTVLGTTVGNLRVVRIFSTGTVGDPPEIYQWTFGDRPAQAAVLRGTGEVVALNFSGITVASSLTVHVNIEWTEE